MKKKGDVAVDKIIEWLIVLLVIIVVVGGTILITGKGDEALEYFNTIWRFGR